MDELILLIFGIVFWRVVIVTVASAIVMGFCAHTFDSFSGVQGIALVAVSFVLALVWDDHIKTSLQTENTTVRSTSKPVAILACAILGFIWGGISSTSIDSAILGAALLTAGAVAVFYWHTVFLDRKLPADHVVFCSFSLLLGYLLPTVSVAIKWAIHS